MVSTEVIAKTLEFRPSINVYIGKHCFLTNDNHSRVTVERCYRGDVTFEGRLIDTSTVLNWSRLSDGCCVVNTRNSIYYVEEVLLP